MTAWEGSLLSVLTSIPCTASLPRPTIPDGLLSAFPDSAEEHQGYLNENSHGDNHFVWLSRKVEPGRARKVKELDSEEVGLQAESRRFYPKKTLAGPVLGFTGMDNQGLEGIERAYDKALRGVSGWVLAEKDAVGRTVFPGGPGFQYKLPKTGHDLILTIDEVIQHIAEKELDAMLRARPGPRAVSASS